MANVVVTGGAGFIGSHIVEESVKHGDTVTVYDNLHSGYMKNIEPFMKSGVRFVKGDIMDERKMVKVFDGADTVYHLAALISVPESMQKKTDYVRVNTIGILNVLEAVRKAGVSNVVHSSSAAVYGDNPVVPKRENMLPEPKSPYAVTKLDGEYYCTMYRKEYGINATALRYFNVFGPRQDPKSQYAAAIPIFVSKAVKGEDITIFGDGEQTRDFVYVKDVAQGNMLAARTGGDVFNVAWGKKITVNDLAKKIIAITGSKSRIVHLAERPGDIKHSVADNKKIVNELGFTPTSDLDKGLAATVEYFVNLHKK
ncbi:MAG: SDR family oxidoreductase [Spirochaetes bacterium]|nr:SDR family oxidoreductase [Spirochaetota bacterium]